LIGKIKDTRGYTSREALWGDSWVNMIMEAADAPRYIRGKRAAPVIETKEDLDRVLGRTKQ
jgi:hypothetical protein